MESTMTLSLVRMNCRVSLRVWASIGFGYTGHERPRHAAHLPHRQCLLLCRSGQVSCAAQVHDAQEQRDDVADIIDGRLALGCHLLLSYNAQASHSPTPYC